MQSTLAGSPELPSKVDIVDEIRHATISGGSEDG
jgi:hypothetical protein